MTVDADLIADRRKLRRRLTVWRVLAFGGVLAAIIAIGLAAGGASLLRPGQYIARININGLITGDTPTLRLLEAVGKDSRVAGVVLAVDSPGGTTTGSEAVYEAARRLSGQKPLVAVVGGLAASGGYIVAMGAERIVARETALVGSIGVLVQYPDLTQLLDNLGVRMESVKSSPLKASPNPFEPTTPEARAALQSVVADSHEWFRRLVRTRRNLTQPELEAVADGRVHTGRQAQGLKLIDQIGGEREAVAWLEREKNVPAGLDVRDRRPRRETSSFDLLTLMEAGARGAGLTGLAATIGRMAQAGEIGRLDGLLAIWHPSLEK